MTFLAVGPLRLPTVAVVLVMAVGELALLPAPAAPAGAAAHPPRGER